MLREVYSFKKDKRLIKLSQQSALDPKSPYGMRIENGLLVGSDDWFAAVEKGLIPSKVVKGVISKTIVSGHNDYYEFEIENSEGKSIWPQQGDLSAYKVGRLVELIYVIQKGKRAYGFGSNVGKCILQIKIEGD